MVDPPSIPPVVRDPTKSFRVSIWGVEGRRVFLVLLFWGRGREPYFAGMAGTGGMGMGIGVGAIGEVGRRACGGGGMGGGGGGGGGGMVLVTKLGVEEEIMTVPTFSSNPSSLPTTTALSYNPSNPPSTSSPNAVIPPGNAGKTGTKSFSQPSPSFSRSSLSLATSSLATFNFSTIGINLPNISSPCPSMALLTSPHFSQII